MPLLTLTVALQAHPAEAAPSATHRHHVRHVVRSHVHHVRHAARPRVHYVRHAARPRVHYVRDTARSRVADCVFTNGGRQVCGLSSGMASAPAFETTYRGTTWVVDRGTIIGSRPAGCPHAYCGCGLRKYLGISDVRLNLAANWARLFPHESGTRAGLAAVRSHHVMYIERSAGNGLWVVRDYNSGAGLSRIHTMAVHGYVFVNPHVALARSYHVASSRRFAFGSLRHQAF